MYCKAQLRPVLINTFRALSECSVDNVEGSHLLCRKHHTAIGHGEMLFVY